MSSGRRSNRDKPAPASKRRPGAAVGAREAAGEVEQRLRSILDEAPIMVYVYDSEGRLLLGNREFERVLGVDRDALIGKTREEFFSPEDAAVHHAPDLGVGSGPTRG